MFQLWIPFRLHLKIKATSPRIMKIFTWNCQGFSNPRTVRELTSLVRSYKPGIVGLLETKIDKVRLDYMRCRLGFKHGFVVDQFGIGGGLALWWMEDVELEIRNFSNFHIGALVDEPVGSRVTLFYVSPHSHLRQHSWNLLRTLAKMSVNPWLCWEILMRYVFLGKEKA